MASYTISNLPAISAAKLADSFRAKTPGISIIDVRDSDYVGGHIMGCLNVPVNTHDYRMPELVRTLRNQDIVIFHCALSQQRGPASALRYLRERDRMAEKGELGIRKDGEDVQRAQRVVVLEGGFVKWQETYGMDTELTEGYAKDLWDDKW
ncbi:Cdc25 phosphatase Ibp1 [Recurvomyces mirabilis]|uniref:Cdc25 phosphatase Ibp1 n=1 Tax=Recurvomyces mirabilis TaxID=574656 RepID=A0AAE1C507_9PEZI|nr:Cdc25 phosphatase Ibp1 [Recurvomyces mirabilis]KAK5151801.1 Cdc25 phosphatase Ibp1 [Recurvomyces mirabilis]